MADIPTPPLPDRTKIWYVGWRFTLLEYEFDDRARKIQDVWLLGSWLYWFFKRIADSCHYAADHCYDFDDLIRNIVKWVNGLIDGTVFRALLYWISGHFKGIVFDAVKWVRQRFAAWNADTSLFVYNPIGWFWKRMTYLADWMENFLLNPQTQMRIWVGNFAWWFLGFLAEPAYYVYGWVLDAHPWLKDFMLNPVGFIVHYWKQYDSSLPYFLDQPLYWLQERLMQLPGELGVFFTNPWAYIRYRIAQYTGITVVTGMNFTDQIFIELFRRVDARLSTYRGWYTGKIADIVMFFM